jgi:ADP-dependent NAD(P)H-hydrate dehydratase / NAD(P)H-hydrate epimerase
MKLVTTAQMRALEQSAEASGIATDELMERAGLAVAQEGWMLLGTLEDRVIVVLVGPGNNGGDGLVAARHLSDWGADVRVHLASARQPDKNFTQLEERSVPIANAGDDPQFAAFDAMLGESHLVIDALLGTGQSRPLSGTIAGLMDRVAKARLRPLPPKLLAVDVPSGLNSDTGAVDPLTVTPDETVTFGAPKIGLYNLPGSTKCGRIETIDIGIPAAAVQQLPIELLTAAWARDHLPGRPLDSNKGTYGRLLAVTGSRNFAGASYLSADSAYRSGAGLVTIALAQSVQPMIVPLVPEATFLLLSDEDGGIAADAVATVANALASYDALVLGCGLGQRPGTRQFVRELLYGLESDEVPGVVIDADGLNCLADDDGWHARFRVEAVLTPHPGEFARLARMTVPEVQADRLGNALRFALQWRKIVVLKGAHTVIALPDGRAYVSPFANAALATAGTGDVLAGAIGGLIAQGVPAADAAATGVYLHAAAGELLSRDFGDAGGLAGDLLRRIPEARREIQRVR